MDPRTRSKLEQWSEKLGIEYSELEEKLLRYVEQIKKSQPRISDELAFKRARFLLYKEIAGALRSPAVPVKGWVIGASRLRDLTEPMRRVAKQILETQGLEECIRQGLCDEQGRPIDNRPTLPNGQPNPFYGQPLQPAWVRDIYMIVETDDGYRFAWIQAIRDKAREFDTGIIGKYVVTRLIEKDDDGEVKQYRTSRVTQWRVEEKPVEELISLLREAPLKIELSELGEVETDYKKPVIVEGDVFMEINGENNKVLVLVDESMMDLENDGVTVFVPNELKLPETLENNHVFVIGRKTITHYNPRTRKREENYERPVIDAYGIIIDPVLSITGSL